ncbi:MAG TPA: Gldg family protein [Vicinamibacterales bacterium]|nr:Gldg family protein [Vicinamibacterales bacterium]
MQKIFGIIGWIGTILVFGALAVRGIPLVGIPSVYPAGEQYATYAAWAGLVCVLIYMAGQWRDVATFYEGRGARYGTVSLVSVAVFLAILIAVNYLGTRQSKRWDLTANQVFSLSDQTIKILKDLKEPVKVTVFERNEQMEVHRARLQEYQYQTTKLTTEFIDPDRQPTRAASAKIETLPTILFEYQGRTERVTSTNEQDLTNALIKAITGTPRKVYFLQGHGEKDTASTDRGGLSTAAGQMTQDNFAFDQLVLVQQKAVPDDATIVVIAGPTTDVFPVEIEALNAYVAKGGKVMVMLDPLLKGPAQPLLTQFLADWGIRAGSDVVLDPAGKKLGDLSVTIAAEYPSHPITAGLRIATVFPMARSMAPIEGGSNAHVAQPLVKTSDPSRTPDSSWSEANVAALSAAKTEPEMNADKGDKPGPITIGAAVSAPATVTPPSGNSSPGSPDSERKPETRIVALGDSDFAINANIGFAGNRDFFMNALSWLSQQENLIAIRPRQPEDRRLSLTPDQQNRIAILTIFLIPGIVFASGVYTWWRRR